jgi:hypothetical protein
MPVSESVLGLCIDGERGGADEGDCHKRDLTRHENLEGSSSEQRMALTQSPRKNPATPSSRYTSPASCVLVSSPGHRAAVNTRTFGIEMLPPLCVCKRDFMESSCDEMEVMSCTLKCSTKCVQDSRQASIHSWQTASKRLSCALARRQYQRSTNRRAITADLEESELARA